ncbi:hypothetical protein ABTB83_17955, partial [Acinetobacter baumannii]
MRRSIAYRQIFHQCFNATCIFTNATSSLNFVNRLRTINRSILLKYQAIMLLYPVGTLLAKNIYHTLYTTNFTEPLSYQDSAFLKLPKFP